MPSQPPRPTLSEFAIPTDEPAGSENLPPEGLRHPAELFEFLYLRASYSSFRISLPYPFLTRAIAAQCFAIVLLAAY